MSPRAPLFDGALRGYLDGAARANLQRATQDALALAPIRSMPGAMDVLAEQAIQQGQINGLLAWWRALPEDSSPDSARHTAVSAVYTRLRRSDDPRTAEWLTQLAATPDRNDQVLDQFAGKLAQRDPVDALQWTTTLPPATADGTFAGLPTAIDAFAARDPRALETWLHQTPPSALRDQALAAYARRLIQNPDSAPSAAQWSNQIQDPKWAKTVPQTALPLPR